LSREVVPRRRNPALADAFGGRIEHHPNEKALPGDRQGFRVVRVRLSREVVPRRRNPALADAFGGRIEHHPNEKALPG